MGEKDNYTQPNIYECIEPGLRFAVLGDIILKKTGGDSAWWPKHRNGYHFKLNKRHVANTFNVITNFTLEHYIDELPPDKPLTRYSVVFSSFQMSDITIVDSNGMPRPTDPRQGKEAAQQALSILMEAAGKEGEEFLETVFDRRFEDIIGRYVLSNFAVRREGEPPAPALSTKIAETALVDHLLRDIEICEEVGALSHESDSIVKQSFVRDAINEDPAPRRRGRYKRIDIFKTVKNNAQQLYTGWKNNVTPEQ